jgi:8-oxo-dGTP diphosphatase
LDYTIGAGIWHFDHRRRLAVVLRRFPWSGRWLQRGYRLLQPRFSVGVVGLVLDPQQERVLLVEHLFHAQHPWGLPGGWMVRGEDPAHTAEREIGEETGLHVRAVRPLVIQRTPELRAHLDVVYLCLLEGESQTVRLSRELLNYRWASRDDLPPLGALHEQVIRAAFGGNDRPAQETRAEED